MVEEEIAEPDSGPIPDSDTGDASEEAGMRVVETRNRRSLADHVTPRLTLAVGLALLLILTGVCGWLGYSVHRAKETSHLRQEFLEVARQGAVNLTTIDFEHADADVKRILDSASGQFLDEFSARSAPFIEVVKKVQSKSVGTVTAAGIESVNGQEGQVLVAVSVTTTTKAVPDTQHRYWRMRIIVTKQGEDDIKVSKVNFVP
jgi:Mce-associated membrane protein